ncbi:retrovirus-related pol polyprotein from transposon TNT 1-94 [Tanacetum coccineum]
MKKFHNDGIGERVMNQVKANNRKEQKIGGFDSEMEHHNVINIMRLLQDDDMEEIQVANMVGLQTVRELEDEFVKKFCMTILKLQEIVNDYDQNKNKKKKKKKQQQPIRSLSKKESKHVTWTGSKNHPPMLNKDNYVPWSSRLFRYAKNKSNEKLIYDSITKADIKQMEADDQAIQTILLGLPEDIYTAVDSCETTQEIWLHVQQMMKGSDIGTQEKKAKLFNKWERFTSTDGESIESYYHRFSKIMNELKRNKYFPEKIASNLKFLNNLQPEWKRHITIVRQTKDLHYVDYTQLYDFLKMNQEEVNELRAKRLAKTHDPLALMAHSQNSYNYPVIHSDQPSPSSYMQQPLPNNNYNPQPSFNPNYVQQTMINLDNISDPTIAMNMALALMAKAFKLSTPTNNNKRISSNPRNRQIAQPGMNMGQDRHIQNVRGNGGNQFGQYIVQNVGNQVVQNPGVQNVGNQNGLIVFPRIPHPNGNQNGTGNVIAARAEGTGYGYNDNQIRCYNYRGLGHYARNCTVRPRRRDAAYLQTQLLIAQKEEAKIQLQAEEYDLMSVAADIDKIEEVNANCILMANLQQASTSGIQTDKAPIYDSDGSAEVHCDNGYNNDDIFNMFTQEDQYYELREPIPESHLVQQNDSDVITAAPSVEQSGGIVEQHFATVEEIHAYYQSLYKNLAVEVKKVNMVNRNMKVTNAELTTELARCKNQEKCFEISQEKYNKLERCYQKSVYQEQCLTKKINALHLGSAKQTTTLNEEITNLNTQLSNEKSTISFLQEERKKLKSYFKKREDELLDKQILLENKIKGLENIRNRLGHNLFSVGQFCDSDLEVAFKRNTCFVRNLKGVYLLKGNQTSNLYTINLHDMAFASRIFLMARATSTKSRLWHQRLSYLNFDTINDLAKNDLVSGLPKFKYSKEHLCPSCEQGKSKRASHPPKPIPNSKSKDEAQEVIITFLKRITVLLQSLSLFSGLDLTYAPSTITTQKLTEPELDLLFEAMYDDNIGGQLLVMSKRMTDSGWIDSIKEKLLHLAYMDSLDDFAKKYKYTGIYDSSTVYDEVNKYLNLMKKFHNDGIGERVMNQVKANNRKDQKIGGFDSEMEHHNVINIMRLLQDDDMEEIQVANMSKWFSVIQRRNELPYTKPLLKLRRFLFHGIQSNPESAHKPTLTLLGSMVLTDSASMHMSPSMQLDSEDSNARAQNKGFGAAHS